MTIRIGANPIGWTNDDLQEIGGETSLETCLAEAKEAGVVGMEKGHKMPSDGLALKDKLAEFGMVFVGGWYSTELLKRSAREEFERGASPYRHDEGRGRRRRRRRRDIELHPWRSFASVVGAPAARKR